MKKLLIGFIIVAGLGINLIPIFFGLFPVTYDQGRDWLWVKNQVDFLRPSLIGPAGSLEGVFFGPLWFWLLSIPYWFFNGSPLAMTLFNAFVVYSGIIIGAVFLKKIDKSSVGFFILLGMISPGIHGLANHAFSQHLLPLLTIVLIYFLVKLYFKPKNIYLFISGLLIGLMYHAEPPIAVFSLPIIPLVWLLSRRRQEMPLMRMLGLGFLAFLIPQTPLIIFDLRHNFLQLQAGLNFLSGNTRGLQEIAPMSFWLRLIDRPTKLILLFRETIINVWFLPAALIFALQIWVLKHIFPKSEKIAAFLKISGVYVLLIGGVFIFYPHDFKFFYLGGVQIIYLVWAALSLGWFWKKIKCRPWVMSFVLLLFFINLKPVSFITDWVDGFSQRRHLGSLYINQKDTIDWIYKDAGGNGFKVYVFVPQVYDYNFQYMFFWRGLHNYGYLPEEFSYWPEAINYVPKKTDQLQLNAAKIKPAGEYIYLIVTHGSFNETSSWRQKFSAYNWRIINQTVLPDDTKIEKYEQL